MPFLTIALLTVLVAASPLLAHQLSSTPTVTWKTANVGTPLLGGSSKSLTCSGALCPAIAIETSAAGWSQDSPDELTFVYQPLTADGAITARVEAPTTALSLPTGSGGLSVRLSLDRAAAATSVVVTASGQLLLHNRTAQGGTTQTKLLGKASGAVWLRLERRGRAISAFRSLDGLQWTAAGQATIPTAQTVYVGVAAASGNSDAMFMAKAMGLKIEGLSSLPSGWSAAEVGTTGSSGSSSYQSGAFTSANTSGVIDGLSDRFRFTYFRATGDAEIVARVVSAGKSGVSQAGLMIREALDGDAAHLFAGITAPTTRLTKRRVGAGLPTVAGPTRTVASPWWLKLARRGTLVTTFESTDGVAWLPVSSETLNLPDTAFLGLAFAAGAGTTAQAVFDQVTVRALAANKPPVVSLTAPAPNAAVKSGAAVALAASASDPDDRVAAVEFYVDGTRVGTDTATPYQATWTASTAGARVIKAVAIDSEGARTTSSSVTLTVTTSSTPPPTLPPLLGRWYLQFTPSADHSTTVDRYVLEVFNLLGVVTTLNLGKPTVTGGNCTVEISSVLALLARGNYVFSVRAVDDGTGRSSTAATTPYTR